MNKVLLSAVVTLAVLQGGCKSQVVEYGEGRYADCVDLGELSLRSRSREDAEDRMRAQVAVLGGDTLLLSERGRTEQLTETPKEIVARRDVVMGTSEVTFEQASSPDTAARIAGSACGHRALVLRCRVAL
jgi:hypothetical protein